MSAADLRLSKFHSWTFDHFSEIIAQYDSTTCGVAVTGEEWVT